MNRTIRMIRDWKYIWLGFTDPRRRVVRKATKGMSRDEAYQWVLDQHSSRQDDRAA